MLSLTEQEELELLELEAEAAAFSKSEAVSLPGMAGPLDIPRPDVDLGPVDAPVTAERRLQYDAANAYGLPLETQLTPGLPPQGPRLKYEWMGGTGDKPSWMANDWMGGIDLGLLSDTAPEQAAALQLKYPGADVRTLGDYAVMRRPGDERVYAPNMPGLNLSDAPVFLGENLPSMAGELVGAVGGLPGMVAGGAAGDLGRQAYQAARGTQFETPEQYLSRAAIIGGSNVVAPAVGAAWRGTKGLVAKKAEDHLGKILAGGTPDDIAGLMTELAGNTTPLHWTSNRKMLREMPALKVFQQSKNPLVQQMAYQAIRFSGNAQKRLIDQMNQLAEAARAVIPGTGSAATPDEVVSKTLEQYYKRTTEAMVPKVDPRLAGEALQAGTEKGLGALRTDMTNAYNATGALVEQYKPKFNVGKAIESAREREINGLALPREEMAQLDWLNPGAVREFVNVAEPNRRLARLNYVLARIDPEQDYAVVKELKESAGRLMDMSKADKIFANVNDRQVSAVFGDLSDAMKNPLGVDEAAAKAIKDSVSNQLAVGRQYYKHRDMQSVVDVLASVDNTTPTALAKQVADHPEMIEREFMDLLERTPAKNKGQVLGTVKNNLQAAIMGAKDPYAVVKQWETTNPQALVWAFNGERGVREAAENAKFLTDLNGSLAKDAASMSHIKAGTARKFLEEAAEMQTRGGAGLAANLRNRLDQVASSPEERRALHRAVRTQVMDDFLRKSLADKADLSVLTIDPKKARTNLKGLVDSGTFDGVLTYSDRRALKLLTSFSQRIWKTNDSGAGLAVAAQLGRMRHGDVGAVANVSATYTLADLLTQETLDPSLLMRKVPKFGWWSSPQMKATRAAIGKATRIGIARELSMPEQE